MSSNLCDNSISNDAYEYSYYKRMAFTGRVTRKPSWSIFVVYIVVWNFSYVTSGQGVVVIQNYDHTFSMAKLIEFALLKEYNQPIFADTVLFLGKQIWCCPKRIYNEGKSISVPKKSRAAVLSVTTCSKASVV